MKSFKVGDDITAALDDNVLGCDGAIGRHAKLECREERVRDLVGRELHAGVLEETLRKHVGKRVVFLVEREHTSVGDLCQQKLAKDEEVYKRLWVLTSLVLGLDLLFAVAEEEELESGWNVSSGLEIDEMVARERFPHVVVAGAVGRIVQHRVLAGAVHERGRHCEVDRTQTQ